MEKNTTIKTLSEAELSIDVYETDNDIVIQSTIAGVEAKDLDISFENGMVIIKGKREKLKEEKQNYLIQECYWGPFSRRVILPEDIDEEHINASVDNGILTLKIPKLKKEKKKEIEIKVKEL